MNLILGESIVSCYVDAVSLLVMILLLLESERLRQQKNKSLRIFYRLSLTVAFTCAVCFTFNAKAGHTRPLSHLIALVSRTFWDLCVLLTVTLWLAYVDCKLYGDRRRGNAVRLIRSIPICIFLVLLVVNLFTGIVFTISDENRLQPRLLFYIMMAVNFLLFMSSAVAVQHFDRQGTKIRFLRVSPMIVSVFAALLPQFFTPYSTGIIGYVIGMTLLYFSMVTELRFVDVESGLYNTGYLAYLFDLAMAGKNDTHSALALETQGSQQACFAILREALHQNGDVIRVDRNKFLMFSNTSSLSTMQYLSSLVEEAVEKHNAAHPDDKVQITARCRMRTDQDNAFSFLRSTLNNQEAGDEMRGIASMITELDRLDKELELAADIQINMLPMNFPPFPDRTEFDLYASMTPAKEVGGDFYDFFLVDSDHLGLVIADVSGKGIPAALFMMVSKTMIKNQLTGGCDPATAVSRVNLQLCEHNSARMFVTMWVAVLEISTGRGLACNAGHENPFVRHGGGSFEELKYKHGIFVGCAEKAKYQNREFQLEPGDCVFVYTDGVPEAVNAGRKMFGGIRLAETLNQFPDATPETLIRYVHDAVDLFADGTPQFDDITMLCLKYNGSPDQKTEPDPEQTNCPVSEVQQR